jgi:hypothetical protein
VAVVPNCSPLSLNIELGKNKLPLNCQTTNKMIVLDKSQIPQVMIPTIYFDPRMMVCNFFALKENYIDFKR